MSIWLWVPLIIFLLITWRQAGTLGVRLVVKATSENMVDDSDWAIAWLGWIALIFLLSGVLFVTILYAFWVLVVVNIIQSVDALWTGGVPKMRESRKDLLEDIRDGEVVS